MMGNITKRSRQFLRAIFAAIDSTDRAFVDQYLNPIEKTLFYNMDIPIQKHCINVARTAQDICRGQDLDTAKLIKAALLHDIGKISGSFGLFHRVLYVLSCMISPGMTEKIGELKTLQPAEKGLMYRVKYAFHVHLNHDRLGAELARNSNLPQDIIFLIENHHNLSLAVQVKELAVLLKADEMN